MGLRISVQCEGCDYRDKMFVGGLRSTPFEEWQWPVFCKGCRSITASHYSCGPLKCLTCGSHDAIAIDNPEIYANDGNHVMHSWFGAALQTMRPVMRTQKVEVKGWRRLPQWLLRKFEGPDADYEAVWTEEQDYERHAILDGHYLCPRCSKQQLRFPSGEQAIMFFD